MRKPLGLYIVVGILQNIQVSGIPYLLFANRKDVQLVDAGNPRQNATVIISGLEDAAAVDFYYDEQLVFWTDVSSEHIKRTWVNGSQISETVISTGLISPDGLACDWLGSKLYWTDSETNRIEVSNLDGSYRKVLFWKNLDQPRAIALDPLNGYMYWTDWGEVPKIEKAGMDGSDHSRSVLIKDDIIWPNGLTLDYEGSRIYWADAKKGRISSCNFDGSDRKLIRSDNLPHPFALTVFGNTLYWTDWKSQTIESCEKNTGAQRKVVHREIYSPMDIHAYDRHRQPTGTNSCGDNNGGCSHLCLMSPFQPYYSCACPTGVQLKADGKTCADGAQQLLLLARRVDIRSISLDTPDYTDVELQLDNIQHAIAVDYDPVDGYVYWTDDEVRAIQRALLDGTGQEVIVSSEVNHPDGIAVDWIARNLYWTDTGTNRIEVARLNGTSRRVLLSEKLDEPRAIALHPSVGYMFWTDWGQTPKIERANLDGSDRICIVNTSLGWPNGVAIDFENRRLYWGDAKTDRIESVNFDGSRRRQLLSEQLPHIFGFSLLGDYVYWTDWQRRLIERVNKNGQDRSVIVDQLPDLMGLKAVNVKEIRGTNPCAKNNGGCSHLCLYRPPPKGATCACPMGLELLANGQTCIVPDAFLLFSKRSDIRRISLETNHNDVLIPLSGIKEPTALDFDINDNRIYWTDLQLKSISRAFMNGSALEHVVEFGLDYPEGMAVDWVAHNIYWADTGTNRIEMARLDGSSRKVLVWQNLQNPRAIALDPPQGYMYWSEWGKKPKIERAALDGSQRKTLVVDNMGRAYGLTIDYIDRRLYWTNLDTNEIQSSDLLGLDRRKIISTNMPKPFGLTQYQDYIYWADWELHNIMRANKTTGQNRTQIQNNLDFVMDILVFHASRQSGGNTCSGNNGGCSHLCISHPRDYNSVGDHHCTCPTHYILENDNKTCSPPASFLLYSQKNAIGRMVVDKDDSPEIMLPIKDLRNVRAIAYDQVENVIYWIDAKHKSIKRSYDNGTGVKVVVKSPRIQPYDMAVEPFSRNIYWTDAQNNVINVTRPDGKAVGVIIDGSSQRNQKPKPRAIALHPYKGYIFWVNMVSQPRIERAMLDGTSSSSIITTELDTPGALAVDWQTDRLYWTDTGLQRIMCSDLDGGNKRNLADRAVSEPVGLAVHGDYLYWVDQKLKLIEKIDKTTGEDRYKIQGRMENLSDIISVVHIPDETREKHPCSRPNSMCSHMCVVDNGKGNGRCACPVDFKLEEDGVNCGEPPTCGVDQFTCKSGGIHCIPQVWWCDGYAECKDGSDENDCPKCKSSEFSCDSGECIDIENECDGHPNCEDGSDERSCCNKEQFKCKSGDCIPLRDKCNGKPNCQDKSDEDNCYPPDPNTRRQDPSPGTTATAQYTVVIVVGLVCAMGVMVTLVFVCKRRNQHIPLEDSQDMLMMKSKAGHYEQPVNTTPPHTITSRGKHSKPGTCASATTVQSNGAPVYDRNRLTGASSSSSSVTRYPKELLNPPPSPVTDRSQYSEGPFYASSNSGSTVRSYRQYLHRNIPPPHTTPCSTDACEDSEPYTSTKKYYNPVAELGYDSDPYPPPPTPRSNCFSDDVSCPPSPSTERSFFNPYPPPPSPVGVSDC